MSASLLLATALLAQSPSALTVPAPGKDTPDVGYVQLIQGQPEAAIEHIRDSRALEHADPSALINLGTAYAMLGRTQDAIASYRAAHDSATRYDLELSDGRWIDSRDAARMAEHALAKGRTLVLR